MIPNRTGKGKLVERMNGTINPNIFKKASLNQHLKCPAASYNCCRQKTKMPYVWGRKRPKPFYLLRRGKTSRKTPTCTTSDFFTIIAKIDKKSNIRFKHFSSKNNKKSSVTIDCNNSTKRVTRQQLQQTLATETRLLQT